MAGRQIYNPDGFKNIEADGKVTGFEFQFKAQYYRGITLSIVRNIKVNVDGVDYPREAVRLTVNGETFTLEEMRTVIDSDYRLGIRRLCNSNRIDRRRTFQRKPPHQYIADYRPVLYAVPDRSDM